MQRLNITDFTVADRIIDILIQYRINCGDPDVLPSILTLGKKEFKAMDLEGRGSPSLFGISVRLHHKNTFLGIER